ncbi:MAG TPA: HoxN/HupN/NixA family nickel/cobalt transporter [Nitrospirae bacterium]|nr:high-affinity nickel transport protein [bacterium BMS3Abin08]HDY70821.1 HoxN/HupN/NixA family nickel/cobalt transporter [Nitrospirota bacterium]
MNNTIFGLSKKRLTLLFGTLIVFNAAAWLSLIGLYSTTDASLLGIGALAYWFGLRHAFDADHIAAIDNVTRKLRQSGQKPVAVGFFFSLGHSTVVILLSLGLVLAIRATKSNMPFLEHWGKTIGTMVSAGFLTLIGLLNLVIFYKLWQSFKNYKSNGVINNEELEELLNKRGFISRIFRFFYHYIDRSWKMYPVGFLFGLGFDTATEVAVLGISAAMAQSGNLPIWSIMIFPLLFTAGMSLLDSSDGVIMLKAYDWAMVDAIRKIFFNMTITGASVFVALLIGTIEWVQVISSHFGWNGSVFIFLNTLDFAILGVFVVGFMLFIWFLAYLYYSRVLKSV